MSQNTVKILLVVVMLVSGFGLVLSAVRADGGSPYTPGDNRIDPTPSDRIAVYLNSDHVDVRGDDGEGDGFALTTFTLPELTTDKAVSHLTADGQVTLRMDSPATWHVGYSDYAATTLTTIVDASAVYTITWTGGPFGADGSAPFTKTFSATYTLPQP